MPFQLTTRERKAALVIAALILLGLIGMSVL